MSIFTQKERTVKCKTIDDALAQARSVLLHIYNIDKLCVNSIRQQRILDTAITIEEMSHWVNQLVDDTRFFEGRY